MVKKVSEKITPAYAEELGLEPCKICKPRIADIPLTSTKALKGENTTTQCKGRTKKGPRCQHMTSIADGYCYQHRSEK